MTQTYPVFVFAVCWRTGSTLLQRVLNTSDDLMIWGEPGYLDLMKRIHVMLTRQKDSQKWMWESIQKNGISNAWIPNLMPPEETTLDACRTFFNILYSASASDLKPQARHWGFKEVRKDAVQNAHFLHQLFPDARFIFHFREPVSCFESIVASPFCKHFADPMEPMKIYRQNLRDVLQLQENPPGYSYMILRHEDLTGPDSAKVIDRLFEYIGVERPLAADDIISGKKLGGSVNKSGLSDALRQELSVLMGDEPEIMGYPF